MRLWLRILLASLLGACSKQSNVSSFQVLATLPLGSGPSEIGIYHDPVQASTTNASAYKDWVTATEFVIQQGLLYVSDTFNHRISVFSLYQPSRLVFSISNQGEDYSFYYPSHMALSKYGDIYVAAADGNGDMPQAPDSNRLSRYYIYKFDANGQFLYRLGKDGVGGEPLPYPAHLSVDTFDTLYVYTFHSQEDASDDSNASYWITRRYAASGEKVFEFSTLPIRLQYSSDGILYRGSVQGVYNFNLDERLLLDISFHPYQDSNRSAVLNDRTLHSIVIYSILKNAVTSILSQKEELPLIFGLSKNDQIFIYSFDNQAQAVRFDIYGFENQQLSPATKFLVPAFSVRYAMGDYFLDDNGNLYNTVIDGHSNLSVIKWNY